MDPKILQIVSEKLKTALRENGVTTPVTPSTPVYGGQSPLDSTQLVSFIVDVEEAVYDGFGKEVSLADERAMSQSRSPFRDVDSLCAYIEGMIARATDGT